MALILCQATDCRHNANGRCSLEEIMVAPSTIAAPLLARHEVPQVGDEELFPGYASELADYAGYMQNHPSHLMTGAICQSYEK